MLASAAVGDVTDADDDVTASKVSAWRVKVTKQIWVKAVGWNFLVFYVPRLCPMNGRGYVVWVGYPWLDG